MLISDAYAQAGPAGQGSILGAMLPLVLLFAVFWFMLIRPQQKRQKEHKAMVETLKKGDEIVTNGGVLGRITKVGDSFVSVEVAEGMEIRVQRVAIATLMPKGTIKAL